MRNCFDDAFVQRNIDLNLNIIAFYRHELSSIECLIEKHAKHHDGPDYHILTCFPGIGRILALTILYEVSDIGRFNTVQDFASYSRLIKCKAESAGKSYGTQGNKIGNWNTLADAQNEDWVTLSHISSITYLLAHSRSQIV